MRKLHLETPLIESFNMSRHFSQRPVYLKMESFQPTGSFKIRGLGHACLQAYEKGCRHFLSSTEGNAGYAVSYAGRMLGIPTTVVIADNIPQVMREKIQNMGAHIVSYGHEWEEAHAYALEYLSQHNTQHPEAPMAYIPPFDLEAIWEGHTSLVDEWTKAPKAVLVAVGGGGLLLGILRGLKKKGWSHVPVFSVETHGSDALARSLKTNTHVHLKNVYSVAHSIALKSICAQAFKEAQEYGVTPLVVEDKEAVEACLSFAQDHNVIVEPACGAALSPIYTNHAALRDVNSAHVVVCGGLGTTYEDLQRWSQTSFQKATV